MKHKTPYKKSIANTRQTRVCRFFHSLVLWLFNDFKSEGLNLSRNTIYEYMSYLEDAFALFTVSLYAKAVREQWRNPRKIYSVDVGFKTAVDYPFSMDTGRIIENIAFLALLAIAAPGCPCG